MTLIDWNEDFSVEILQIDEQHQSLIHLINRLYEAVVEEKDPEHLGPILLELKNYAHFHFKTEEECFREWGYPGAEKHLLEHLTFNKNLQLFKKGFESGVEIGVSVRLLDYLCTWLKNHILVSDRPYGVFFKENGKK
jgi:hemerythrin-like metal-binding protein